MRKLTFRFTIALICFSLGLVAMRLAAPLRSLHTHQSTTHDEVAAPGGMPASSLAEDRAAAIAETLASLRKIETEQFDAQIPRAAKPLLTRLKHQLRAFISDTINSEEGLQATPQYLQTKLLVRLQESGVKVQRWEEVAYSKDYFQKPYAYGDIYDITVEQPAGHPELLVATTTLGICCGEDTSLYLFKKDEGTWRLVLAQEANDYDKVSGGQGLFQYAISPTDAQGDFFVVTANVSPWCSSNWQSLRYKVLRAGPDPYQPRTILSAEDTIYLGVDSPYEIHVKEKGFTLEFFGESNPEEITRKHVVSYRIKGDRVAKAGR
jgi:hypothetical protein